MAPASEQQADLYDAGSRSRAALEIALQARPVSQGAAAAGPAGGLATADIGALRTVLAAYIYECKDLRSELEGTRERRAGAEAAADDAELALGQMEAKARLYRLEAEGAKVASHQARRVLRQLQQ